MSKRANPKLIGGFVLGAIALVIIGLLAFGSGQYFAPKGKAVLYFAGSLAGLDVGSPVTFRGVKVGTVTKIVIQYDIREQKLRIPVYIELNPEKFQIVSGKRSETNINELVQRGLRAQLQIQSLVTGQTSVDFDFYPDTPIHMVAGETAELELPTIPSNIDMLKANLTALLAKISKLPLEQISAGLVDAIASANQMLKQAQTVVQRADGLVVDLNAQVKPLPTACWASRPTRARCSRKRASGWSCATASPCRTSMWCCSRAASWSTISTATCRASSARWCRR